MRRVELGRDWGERSTVARQCKREKAGVDADTLKYRASQNARGQIERHGVNYTASGSHTWEIRRSIAGSIDQVDLVIDGITWKTGGRRTAERAVKTGKWRKGKNQSA
jgi:hypothetical protein